MKRATRLALVIGSAASLTLIEVIVYRHIGAVYVGPSSTLTQRAINDLDDIQVGLEADQRGNDLTLANGKTIWTSFVEPFSNKRLTYDARILSATLIAQNQMNQNEGELNALALRQLLIITKGLKAGLRYEPVDSWLQEIEHSFIQRDIDMEALSDERGDVAAELQSLEGATIRSFSYLPRICGLQTDGTNLILSVYRDIKMATKSDRVLVDELASGHKESGQTEK